MVFTCVYVLQTVELANVCVLRRIDPTGKEDNIFNQWKPPARPAACRHRDESGQDGFAGAKLTVTSSNMTSLPLSVGPGHSEELAIEQIED